jgi:hypothetical protein
LKKFRPLTESKHIFFLNKSNKTTWDNFITCDKMESDAKIVNRDLAFLMTQHLLLNGKEYI